MTGLHVRAKVADRGIDVDFSVAPGEVLALLGPNGAGKSTVLQTITGLISPDDGVVALGERVLTDTSNGIDVATHDRRVGMLMQNPLLFPHLSVANNVAFAPRSHGTVWHRLSGSRKGDARSVATRWLAEVGASELANRMPRSLSGGQAQRVAIARALAAEPDVLLLDEPLAGLDVSVATEIRKVLRAVLTRQGRSAVLVTHDLLDVLTLADRVVVLESGGVAETGSVAAVVSSPRSRFGARLAGVNLVFGTIDGDGALITDWGQRWSGVAAEAFEPGSAAVATFSPAAVAVYRDVPHGSPRNVLAVTVAEMDTGGSSIRLRANPQPDGSPGLAADVTAEAVAELTLVPGEEVYFSVKAGEIRLLSSTRATSDHL